MIDAPRHVAVVGGGISGLAAAHRLIASAPPASIRVTVLEASPRFGGWIRTESFAGRPVDFGPDSLLVRTPWAAELARELEIEDELVSPGAGGAYILSRGKLRTLPSGILAGLPDGPVPFVKSGLLGPAGIARAALDLVLPKNAPDGDESVGDLVRRRLGGQALERVIDPLLGGVHAGSCDQLSLASTAPQIAVAARADRSLLRGLRKTAPPAPAPGAPVRPVFMGPRAGMQRIVDALVGELSEVAELRTGVAVTGIESVERGPSGLPGGVRLTVGPAGVESRTVSAGPSGGPSRVDPFAVLAEPAVLDFDGVIIAIPAGPAAHLIGPHAAQAATTLLELPYATVAQTALAYDPADLPDLPTGTGYLVPRPEGTLMTACTFLDQKWPERRGVGQVGAGVDPASHATAADGAASTASGRPGARSPVPTSEQLRKAVVIKCSAGRIDDTRGDGLDDIALVSTLHGELAEQLGFDSRTRPIATRVFRARGALPQYAPGHADRIDGVLADVARVLPAVTLTGAAYRGTSVPICIREGRAAADAQLARLLPPA